MSLLPMLLCACYIVTWFPWCAVYAVLCHAVQNGDMYGGHVGDVKPEDLTLEVWDYIFLKGPYPADCKLPEPLLAKMRAEFEFWYPFDLRVSGELQFAGVYDAGWLDSCCAVVAVHERVVLSYFGCKWDQLWCKGCSAGSLLGFHY